MDDIRDEPMNHSSGYSFLIAVTGFVFMRIIGFDHPWVWMINAAGVGALSLTWILVTFFSKKVSTQLVFKSWWAGIVLLLIGLACFIAFPAPESVTE